MALIGEALDSSESMQHEGATGVPVVQPSVGSFISYLTPGRALTLRKLGGELCCAYSSIVFLRNPLLGFALCLITFLEPGIAFCGLISLATSFFLLHVLHLRVTRFRGIVFYNSLLTGLFMGFIFQLDWKVGLLTAGASALCLVLTAVIDSVLYFYALPVLSLPFTLCALLLALARPQFSNLSESSAYHIGQNLPLPDVINLALKCLGSIFCIQNPLFGALVMGLLLVASPWTATFFAGGFFLGHQLEGILRLGQTESHLLHQFNYSLTFTAICLVFLKPSRKSICVGLVAVVLTSIISLASTTFWAPFQIPLIPFSFNVTALILLRAAGWLDPASLRSDFSGSPEEALDHLRLFRLRENSGQIGIFCPFAGEWCVQQGFGGKWTHRGLWQHAFDFVKHGTDQKTFANQGFEVEDYHCFGQGVPSPVDGVVVAIQSEHADNPIGSVDHQNNWGNYVMLRAQGGFHVLLAHLKKDSVLVKPGDSVQVSRLLGHCGNSGYSQEPHLHVQVQRSSFLGDGTIPFTLFNYREGRELRFSGRPEEGAKLSPFSLNLPLERALNFKIGEKFQFRMEEPQGIAAKQIEVSVELDEGSGSIFLTDGTSRLSFGKWGNACFFYGFKGSQSSLLADLFRAGPRIPLVFGDQAHFWDALPARLMPTKRPLIGPGLLLVRELFGLFGNQQLVRYEIDPRQLDIRGEGTFLKLDPILGITQFIVKGKKYERVF